MKSILSAVVAATLALVAIETDAQGTPGERQVSLTIESTTLATALDKWAQQSGFQIFVQDWEATKNITAPSLRGTFAAQAALEQLLEGTALTYVWLNDNAVSIRKKVPQTVPAALQRTGLEGQPSLPVAKFSEDDGGGASIPLVAAAPGSSEAGSTDLRRRGVEEVVVTGTHIRGNTATTSPVAVLDRAYIESSGFTTTTGLMQALPQNFASANQTAVAGAFNNAAQGSSINLRGIGEGTTLTLLNGRRLAPGFNASAADISALPLAAIERVEILLDGASAIYGSDAIGGVVNFVTRQDYKGAETRIRSGWAEGLQEHTISQMFGHAWSGGNALVALGYYKRDLLHTEDRDFVPQDSQIGSLLPRDEVYSGTFTARQDLGGGWSLFADALYADRKSFNEGGQAAFNVHREVENPQLTATAGLTWLVGQDWQLEVSGTHATNVLDLDAFDLQGDTFDSSKFTIRATQVKADGSLFELPGGRVRVAVGADWRSERYESRSVGFSLISMDVDQIVRSAFGELQIPLVGSRNERSAIRRLELSLAGRFDDYSNFGSSFDPKFGLMWEPTDGVRLRASHGTSYKAPNLPDYSLGANSGFGLFGEDPIAPGGTSYRLSLFGVAPETYTAQESTSSSFGVEFRPHSIDGSLLALNYYRIKYENRIAEPSFDSTAVLANPAVFAEVTTRNPSIDQVMRAIDLANLGFGFVPFDADFNVDPNFDPSSVDVLPG